VIISPKSVVNPRVPATVSTYNMVSSKDRKKSSEQEEETQQERWGGGGHVVEKWVNEWMKYELKINSSLDLIGVASGNKQR
jgi:uncharacterized membrane protein YdbT with pleckstrin-like domain